MTDRADGGGVRSSEECCFLDLSQLSWARQGSSNHLRVPPQSPLYSTFHLRYSQRLGAWPFPPAYSALRVLVAVAAWHGMAWLGLAFALWVPHVTSSEEEEGLSARSFTCIRRFPHAWLETSPTL